MNRNFIFTFVLLVLGATLTVSCGKNEEPLPVEPEEPALANFFQYGNDSIAIDEVLTMQEYGYYEYAIVLENGTMFQLITSENPLNAGMMDITAPNVFYETEAGALGMLIMEDDGDALVAGHFSITATDNVYEMHVDGTTESGQQMAAYYRGMVTDLSKPCGTGSFSIGGMTVPLNIAFRQVYDGMYEYALSDTLMANGVTFYSTFPFADGATYPITDNEAEQIAGRAVGLYVEVGDEAEGDYVWGDATNGTLSCDINGDTYTLTFNGTMAYGSFTGSYTGKINELKK